MIFKPPPAKNGRPKLAAPIATPASTGPNDWATPRTAPVIATAPARSSGGTIDPTYACLAGTSICESAYRASKRPAAHVKLGLNGTSSKRTLDGRGVKTIVLT